MSGAPRRRVLRLDATAGWRSFRLACVARWRAFWFPVAPLSDLAIARVLLVAIVLYLNGSTRFHFVPRAPDIAWEPIALVEMLGLSQPTIEQAVLLRRATTVLLVAGALGVATNVALLGAFALQLAQEALLNCFGKVTHSTIPLLHAMLFLALSPCGRVWSVDAWLRRRALGSAPAAEATSRFARWPFELTFVELAFYYFNAGYAKLARSGLAWADGDTLQYYLLERGLPAGAWVAEHPLLCTVLSFGALAFELGFPLAIVIRRLRLPFLATGVAFHVGNHVLHDLAFWPVPATYLLAVPWSELRDRVAAWSRRTGAGSQREPLPPLRASGEPSGG